MPYKDPVVQREYQRLRTANRRFDWFADKSCARCGSTENLQLDHIDPSTKISHKIWSWSEAHRETELVKCQVLCYPCHVIKGMENGDMARGSSHGSAKLTSDEVFEIRGRWYTGEGLTALGKEFGVTKHAVHNIVNRKTWRWL